MRCPTCSSSVAVAVAALAIGCVDSDPICGDPASTEVAVMTTLDFARPNDKGQSSGFDLDGRISDVQDPMGCHIPDLRGHSGEHGIDNAFARLFPAMDLVGGDAIAGLVQTAINQGDLLLMVELEGVDDLADDACVDVSLLRGAGLPVMGTDGFMLSGQTFDRDLDKPNSRVEGARIRDGVVVAGPFDLDLPVQIFEVSAEFTIRDATLELHIEDDGSMWGALGGAVQVAQVRDFAAGVDEAVAQTLANAIDFHADLDPDGGGGCDQISVAIEYRAARAFFFDDP